MKNLITNKITIFVLLASTLMLGSCFNCVDGVGPKKTENRELEAFSKLEVNISADVMVHFGDENTIKISAQENLLSEIETYVQGKTFIIDSRYCLNPTETIRIDITTKNLSSITLNGSGGVHTSSVMEADDVNLQLNGSGQISADIFSNTLDAAINGSGDIIVNGTTQDLDMEINGSGDFKALGLKSFEADISIAGSGDADIKVLNELKVNITGSGSVTYVGSPEIKTKVTGSGKVTKKDN